MLMLVRCVSVCLAAGMCLAAFAQEGVEGRAVPSLGRADVTRFGAIPDDGNDDTEAIERAAAWAMDRNRRKQMRPRGSSAVGWSPTVYFPTGRYRLKRQIRLTSSSSLTADAGRAVIEWTGETEGADAPDSMFWFRCYTNRIRNLMFVGGRTQLHFQNPNTNQTMVDIAGCEFQHARGIAVRATPSGAADHLSTVLTIRNCKFMRNYQCLETYCDITRVVDTWVEFSAPFCAMDEAVFVNRSGKLMFENMVGVPGVCKDKEAMNRPHALRWVDNHASFYATFSRFGGEGAGMPAVFHYAQYRDRYPFYSGGTVDITHSSLNVGSMRDDAAVIRLFAVPTQVTIRDCKMVNAPIFRVDPSLDLESWKADIPAARRQFRYVLEPNYSYPRNLHETIPEALREFVFPPAHDRDATNDADTETAALTADVTAFGARGDGMHDDTDAIREAVAFVRSNTRRAKRHSTHLKAQPALYVPPGLYLLSDTIDVAGLRTIRGTNASLIQDSPDKPVFASRHAYRLVVEGLHFSGGSTHLLLWNENINMGHIVLRDCSFNDSTGAAVHLQSGAQSTDLLIESCMFRHCDQALITHTDITRIKDSWIQTAPAMSEKAVIEHRGQRLFLENITGVPLVNGNDQRWVDCHGAMLSASRCRFGAEGGGFTPVVNWHPGAAISLTECTVSAEGNAKRQTAVYLEQMATLLVVRDCSMATPPIMVSPHIDLQTCFLDDALVQPHIDVTQNRMPAFELPPGLATPHVDALPIDNLSQEETRARLEEIVTLEQAAADRAGTHALPPDAQPITPTSHLWDLTDTMDTLAVKNADYLAVAQGPAGTILLKRCRGRWPHVLIRNVVANLDTHPMLCWRTPDRGDSIDGHSYAVKVVDTTTGQTSTIQRRQVRGDHHCHDLREVFGAREGNVTFNLKVYYLGYGPYNDAETGEVVHKRAGKGEYMVIEQLYLAPE